MLKKKKQKTAVHTVDESSDIVYDFCLRTSAPDGGGFEDYRPVDYYLYGPLSSEQMIPFQEEHLDKLFSGVDRGNGDVLDDQIFSVAKEAMANLSFQESSHSNFLRRYFMWVETSLEDFQEMIRTARAELEDGIDMKNKIQKLLAAAGEEV